MDAVTTTAVMGRRRREADLGVAVYQVKHPPHGQPEKGRGPRRLHHHFHILQSLLLVNGISTNLTKVPSTRTSLDGTTSSNNAINSVESQLHTLCHSVFHSALAHTERATHPSMNKATLTPEPVVRALLPTRTRNVHHLIHILYLL